MGGIIMGLIGCGVLILILSNVRIVPESYNFVIERLGAYLCTWQTGIHVKIPFMDRISKKVDLKEQVVDFDPQPVITKDNITMHIDTVIYLQVTDPKKYTYGVDRPMMAIENLTATTLRNIIGDLDLESCLTSRDEINARITSAIDVASDPWGIKVFRVELKNIMPPKDIQEAMEKQLRAERQRRATVLEAEGDKQSEILRAQGTQEALVLKARAEKDAAILKAEANKQAVILAAEAEKEKRIRESEGEATAIEATQKAKAEGIERLNAAVPSNAFIRLRALEAFEKAADGQATKLIIPSDIQKLAGMVASLKETAQ